MNLWRAILSVVLLMGVTGCVSWQRVPRAQDGALTLATAGPVRLTLKDGTVVVLERPRIQGDSLVGGRSGSHATGTRAGYGRGERVYCDAGVSMPNDSCGRSALYSARNALKARCCAAIVARAGRIARRLSARCIRSCAPFSLGVAGVMR